MKVGDIVMRPGAGENNGIGIITHVEESDQYPSRNQKEKISPYYKICKIMWSCGTLSATLPAGWVSENFDVISQ